MSWSGVGEIFNPGERHVHEEMERKRVEAQIPGSEGSPNGVDLDAGIVHITRPATPVPPADQDLEGDMDLEDQQDHGDREERNPT